MTAELQANFEKRFAGGPLIECRLQRPAEPSITVLFGPSGSGKTTILRCLAGLDRPQTGLIRLADQTWFDAQAGISLPPQQRGIGYLLQEYALFPHLSVARNIAYGLNGIAAAEQASRVNEMVGLLQLAGLEDRFPSTLSGGQRQRVALARALARRPRLLLLDEPLSALDSPTRDELRSVLRQLIERLAIPALLVTHDRTEAISLGDHVVVLDGGLVVQSGPVHEVFQRPATSGVARITGIETVVPGRIVEVVDGLATVDVGGAQLHALATCEAPLVYACIRAEDVILEAGDYTNLSPRNRWPARILSIHNEGPMARLHLECGFTLQALVTNQSVREMQLAAGGTITALVKAPAVHLVLRSAG